MKILIPPSEGKSKFDISNIEFIKTKNLFLDEIKKILEILSSVKNEELVKIYGTSFDKSKIIHDENLNILNNRCSQAIERYTGVVYNNFDFKSLDESSKKFAEDKILITSGFLGLVKLNDLIPNYKLKMNSLKLSAFWKPTFSNYLKDEGFIEQAVELAKTPAMQDILALDKGLQGQFTKLEEISKAEKLVFSKKFEGNSQLRGEMLEDIRKQKIGPESGAFLIFTCKI